MKKILLLVLIVFSAGVFFAGWVQFIVPPGHVGIMASKTSGYDADPIVPGDFDWRWERLIPTNATILVFEQQPVHCNTTIQGVLPSGDLYSRFFEGSPDFSWSMSVKITGKFKPARLVELVDAEGIADQQALNEQILDSMEKIAETEAYNAVIEALSNPADFDQWRQDPQQIVQKIESNIADRETGDVLITNITVTDMKIPDFSLYLTAAETYQEYQRHKSLMMAKLAAEEASSGVAEYLQIERLSQWGELLTKYPILIDFMQLKDREGAPLYQ